MIDGSVFLNHYIGIALFPDELKALTSMYCSADQLDVSDDEFIDHMDKHRIAIAPYRELYDMRVIPNVRDNGSIAFDTAQTILGAYNVNKPYFKMTKRDGAAAKTEHPLMGALNNMTQSNIAPDCIAVAYLPEFVAAPFVCDSTQRVNRTPFGYEIINWVHNLNKKLVDAGMPHNANTPSLLSRLGLFSYVRIYD